MKTDAKRPEGPTLLKRNLSPLAVWALSFGCAVGWGSFVMPGTTFLPIAGPIGTTAGILVGALIMLIIGFNYCFLIERYPEAGGTFTYTRNAFGYDHGFLSAWFLILVYLAIIWANATAIPLIFRTLIGDALHFGFHYTIAGYDIWFGEILLSVVSIGVFGLLTLRGGKTVSIVQIALAIALIVLVTAGFIVTVTGRGGEVPAIRPRYSPEHTNAVGILFIIFLAPWAFAGFESVSHSAEEFRFQPKKTLPIVIVALVTSSLAYIFLALIATTAQPEGHSDWFSYIRDLGSYSGVESNPVFYGIYRAMGKTGLVLFGIAAACGIITGLIGNLVAASRMIYAMAADSLLPSRLKELNRFGAPKYAILFLILISLPIPFLGRSATGWIIDVNTIGIIIAYTYTSAVAMKLSFRENKPLIHVTSILGIAVSGFFLLYFLIPTAWSVGRLSTESYMILLAWSVLGFVVFNLMYRRDPLNRMGKSTVVWVFLLLMIFFASFIWVFGETEAATDRAVATLSDYYANELSSAGAAYTVDRRSKLLLTLEGVFGNVTSTILRNSVIQFILILASILIIFRIYGNVRKSHETAVQDKTIAEQSSQAKTTFLSNMSHDIRTPMNAIIGYVSLAKREKNLSPRVEDYLTKIQSSSDHLLALINDVLEMSRIESGRMELAPIPIDVTKMMDDVRDLFSTQMKAKKLTYDVKCVNVRDRFILCDRNRMNRVLLNLISNAFKFTPEGGTVSVTLEQTGRDAENGRADYVLRVKDSGIGMSKEFAEKVFEAYERERTDTVESIQGTGLGTAITKSIVDLMGGTIDVETEQGKGTEFIIRVSFPIDPDAAVASDAFAAEAAAGNAFRGMRVLLVEDNDANREMEKVLFENIGFTVDAVENGMDAVEAIASSVPGEYSAVLMDIEMPVRNGIEATKTIRSLKNPALAGIPIIAVSARAFSEDIAAVRDAGMNGHIAKPIDMNQVVKTLSEILLQG